MFGSSSSAGDEASSCSSLTTDPVSLQRSNPSDGKSDLPRIAQLVEDWLLGVSVAGIALDVGYYRYGKVPGIVWPFGHNACRHVGYPRNSGAGACPAALSLIFIGFTSPYTRAIPHTQTAPPYIPAASIHIRNPHASQFRHIGFMSTETGAGLR